MSVARVAGHPDYTNAGDSRFIPEVWSGKLKQKFYLTTIWSEISNTD